MSLTIGSAIKLRIWSKRFELAQTISKLGSSRIFGEEKQIIADPPAATQVKKKNEWNCVAEKDGKWRAP